MPTSAIFCNYQETSSNFDCNNMPFFLFQTGLGLEKIGMYSIMIMMIQYILIVLSQNADILNWRGRGSFYWNADGCRRKGGSGKKS